MANLLFVHGASANEKSWFDVPAAFKDDHVVENVQLAGHDKPPQSLPDTSIRMSDYLASIDAAMDGRDDWILIGHSMGGMVISQFAADHPDRVAKLIYVSAILPREGQTVSTLLDITTPEAFIRFLARVAGEFANHNDPRIPGARSAQPPTPLNEGFRSSSGFEDIPRYYIHCDGDGVVLPDQQKDMVDEAPGGPMATTTEHLDSDHFSQLSVPSELVTSLTRAINA